MEYQRGFATGASYKWPIIFALMLLLAWECCAYKTVIPNYLLPAPSAIASRFITSRAIIFEHAMVTLLESILGFLIATAFGILAAVAIVYSSALEKTIYPYVVIAKVIPVVAIAPLVMLWLGFGIASKVAISALISFFPTVVNTVKGLRSIDPQMLKLMQTLSATQFEIFLKIRLPSSLPYLFSALRISIALSLVGAIVGEFTGSDKGLGHLIMLAQAHLDTELTFSSVAMCAVIGIVLFFSVGLFERYFLFWHDSTNGG